MFASNKFYKYQYSRQLYSIYIKIRINIYATYFYLKMPKALMEKEIKRQL